MESWLYKDAFAPPQEAESQEEHTYGYALVVRSTNPRPHELEPILRRAIGFQVPDFQLVLVSVDGNKPE